MTTSTPAADPATKPKAKKHLKARSIILHIIIVVVVIGALAWLGRYFGEYIPEFEIWIKNLGIWGPIVFALLFLLITGLQAPESLLAVAAGVAFGFLEGIILVVIINVIGAVLWFWIARKLLRSWVHRVLERHPKLEAIEEATAKEGFKLMVLLRLGPFSYGMLNFMLGASDAKFWPYAFALIGVIPGNLVTVYFGAVANHVAKKAAHADNLSDTHFVVMIVGFAVTIIVVAIVAHVAHRALKKYQPKPVASTQPA